MRRNPINFLYNSGHVTLWCVEVGQVANVVAVVVAYMMVMVTVLVTVTMTMDDDDAKYNSSKKFPIYNITE